MTRRWPLRRRVSSAPPSYTRLHSILKSERRWFWATAAALSCLVVGAIWCVDYIPTNDGPQHLFLAYASQHLGDADKGYGRYLEPGAPLTSLGFHTLYGAALRLWEWRPALRVTLSIMALGWAWSVVALAASLRRPWLGILGFAGAFQWSFYMGFFSFYIAMAFGFTLLAVAGWRPHWRPIERVALSGLLLCTTMCHTVVGAIMGAALTLEVVLRRRALGDVLLLALMGLPSLAILLLAPAGPASLDFDLWPEPWATHLTFVARTSIAGPAWRCWPAVAWAGLGLVLWARESRHQRVPHAAALWLVGLACLLVAIAGPVNLRNWQFFSMRFGPIAIVLLAVLTPIERLTSATTRAGAVVVMTLYAATSIGWAAAYNRELVAGSADVLAGLDAPVRREGPRLDLVMTIQPMSWPQQDRPIPYLIPFWNIGPLFAVAQGGVPPRIFAWPGGTPLMWRRQPQTPYPLHPTFFPAEDLASPEKRDDRALYTSNVLSSLTFVHEYEDVIFHGNPEDLLLLRQRGFTFDFHRGGFALARFAGCPVTIEIEPEPDADSPKTITAHWSPTAPPAVSFTLPSGAPSVIEIPHSPCGELWVRVLYDRDRSGTPSRGDRICAEARGDGFVRVPIPVAGTRFKCRPGAVAGGG